MGAKFTLFFGAMSGSITDQLDKQDITLPRKHAGRLQRAADGVTQLSLGGFLSESEAHKARQRIVRCVQRLAAPKVG